MKNPQLHCASSVSNLLDVILPPLRNTNSIGTKTLVLWDIDDTLLCTHKTLGPRKQRMLTDAEIESVLFPKQAEGQLTVHHVLLSQGTVLDTLSSIDAPLYCFCEAAAASPPTHVSLRITPTAVTAVTAEQHTVYLQADFGGPGSLVGISLSPLGRASPPSSRVAHLDSSTFTKMDIAHSMAHSGHWDRVVLVDNSLLELGIAQPGLPKAVYSSEPIKNLPKDTIEELYGGRLLQFYVLQDHHHSNPQPPSSSNNNGNSSHLSLDVGHFKNVLSRLQLVHFRTPSASKDGPHHKIFPGEFGCSNERYDAFISGFFTFITNALKQAARYTLPDGIRILSLHKERAEKERVEQGILQGTRTAFDFINEFVVSQTSPLLVPRCILSNGISDPSERQSLRDAALDLYSHLTLSCSYANPRLFAELHTGLHRLVYESRGGETIPPDTILSLHRICLETLQNIGLALLRGRREDPPHMSIPDTSKSAAKLGASAVINYPSLPADPHQWQHIRRVWRPEEGSSAFFVELTDGRKFAIKGSMNVAGELFANIVMCACGLHVPQCRLVSWPTPEWRSLKASIKEFLSGNIEFHAILRFTDRVMNRSVLIIQEFVDAVAAVQASADENQTLLLSESVGGMLAMDVALNNSDRVPFGNLWGNDGNSNNIILARMMKYGSEPLEKEEGVILFIPVDNQLVPLNPAMLPPYISKLTSVVRSLPETLKSVAAYFSATYGVSLDCTALQQSFVCTSRRLASVAPHFGDLIIAMRDLVAEDWEHFWGGCMESIKLAATHQIPSSTDAIRNALNHAAITPSPTPTSISSTAVDWRTVIAYWKPLLGSKVSPESTPFISPVATECSNSADEESLICDTTAYMDVCICCSPRCAADTAADALKTFASTSTLSPLPHLLLFSESTLSNKDLQPLTKLSTAFPGVVMVLGSTAISLPVTEGSTAEPLLTQRCTTVKDGRVTHVYDKQFLRSGVAHSDVGNYTFCMPEAVRLPTYHCGGQPTASQLNVRFATLICRDVEDRGLVSALVKETQSTRVMRHEGAPTVVASPILLGGDVCTVEDCQRSVSMGTRKLEPICFASLNSQQSPLHFIRADTKFPVGMGNSQVVTPHFTIYTDDPSAELIMLRVPLSTSISPFSPQRHVYRSSPSDDIGKRITVRVLVARYNASTYERGHSSPHRPSEPFASGEGSCMTVGDVTIQLLISPTTNTCQLLLHHRPDGQRKLVSLPHCIVATAVSNDPKSSPPPPFRWAATSDKISVWLESYGLEATLEEGRQPSSWEHIFFC